MRGDFFPDGSSGFGIPYFDEEKPRHRQSGSLTVPAIDLDGFPKQDPLDNSDRSRTSGSVYHPKEQLTQLEVPSHSVPNAFEPVHLGHEGFCRTTSLQLDGLFTNHRLSDSDWADPRAFSEWWDDFPVQSYTQEMVLAASPEMVPLNAASPETVGGGESSSHAHASRHETATDTRTCFEGERSRGRWGDPILRDGSRSAAKLYHHRQPEDPLKVALPSTLENKGREFELTFKSMSSSQNSISAASTHSEGAALVNSRCIVTTSATPPIILRKTTMASPKVCTMSADPACAVFRASSPVNGISTAAQSNRILPLCTMPNANMLDGLQPRSVLKRGAEVELNCPKTGIQESKLLPSKHRRGLMMDHVERERRRRDIMAGKLAILEDLLPEVTSKRDRISILYDAVEHITRLQQDVQVLKDKRHILAAAKCKTELSKGPVKMLRIVNVESSSRSDPSSDTGNALLKSMDTCRLPTGTLPRLGDTKMCKQPVLDADSLPIQQGKMADGPDSNQDRKSISVEFHMQLDNTSAQALQVVRCQCKANYLSSTMRTLQDMKLDVFRCNVMKMQNQVVCVLFLKAQSNASKYTGTRMSTQFAARLQYNQLKF